MGKVHQQDELDDDEDEGAHHAKVIPDWGQAQRPSAIRRDVQAHNSLGPPYLR